jgi:hypothetical protein
MHQATLLDGCALDALTLQQNGLPPAEIDSRRGQVVQAFVIAPVVTLLDELVDLSLQRARQVVILQQNAVLRGLVPAFDLGALQTCWIPCCASYWAKAFAMNPGPLSESNRGRWCSGTSRQPGAVMASSSVSLTSLAVMPMHSRQAMT